MRVVLPTMSLRRPFTLLAVLLVVATGFALAAGPDATSPAHPAAVPRPTGPAVAAAAPPIPLAAPAAPTAASSSIRPADVVTGFSGLNSTVAGCDCNTTDLSLAVGPNNTLEAVGGHIVTYSPSATPLALQTLPQFFGAGTSARLAHAAVGYDRPLQRFVAVADNLSSRGLLLGMSGTSNSTSSWHFWPLAPLSADLLGRPSLGISGPILTLAATAYNRSTGVPVGTDCWDVNATALRNTTALLQVNFGPIGVGAGTTAVSSSTGVRDGLFVLAAPARLTVTEIHGVPPFGLSQSQLLAPLTAYGAPVASAQPGTNRTLAAPSATAVSGFAGPGGLVIARTVSIAGSDAIQLAKVNLTTGAVAEDLTEGTGMGLFAPGVAVDATGDLEVLADRSNATTYPSLVEFGQPYNEPGQLLPLETAAFGVAPAGTDCNSTRVCQWGNLSAATPDPINPTIVWLAGASVDGTGANFSTYIVLAKAPPLAAAYLASDLPSIDLGQAINFTAIASGGTGAYTYNWTGGLPPGCTPYNFPTIGCRPAASGSFVVRVNITDGAGVRATSMPLNFTVYPDPIVTAPIANRTSLDAGQAATFTTTVGGGRGPYVVSWAPPASARCNSTIFAEYNCTFTAAGTFGITVTLSDGNAYVATNLSPFVVLTDPTLSAIQVGPLPAAVDAALNLSVTAAGGSGSYSYTWTGLPAGCATDDLPTIACTPTAAGSTTVVVTVRDTNGVATTASLALQVQPRSSVSTGGPIPLIDWVLVGLVAIVAVALLLVFLPRRPAPANRNIVPVRPYGTPTELRAPEPGDTPDASADEPGPDAPAG